MSRIACNDERMTQSLDEVTKKKQKRTEKDFMAGTPSGFY